MRKRITCMLLCFCLFLLAGCGREDMSVPLTEEQIARANEAFTSEMAVFEEGRTTAIVYSTEISCFFTSFYSDPSQIDLREFLLYCPIDTILEDSDAEEFQAVMAADGNAHGGVLPSDYVVPVHRYRKADVSALLKKYADITVDELANTENALYLEEYDSFYNFTSDFGPGYFQCVGGEIQGDTIRLWSEVDEEGSRSVLTIREVDGKYFIQAFEKIEGEIVPSK